MMNLPGGHQQSWMPAASRWSPAFAPLKVDGAPVLAESSTGLADSTRLQPSTHDTSRTNAQNRLVRGMNDQTSPHAAGTNLESSFGSMRPPITAVGVASEFVNVMW